jgi:glutamate synthase (NADPH) large chain
MEPWDGPAAVAFTDGRQIGATLDRNGLRPARYVVTDDDRVIMASEAGVLPVEEEKIVTKVAAAARQDAADRSGKGPHRLRRGDQGGDRREASLSQWLKNTQLILEELKPVEPRALRKDVSLLDRQQAYGYTQEDLKLLMAPMATTGQEAVGSMGTDTPISAMSDKSKLLYTYFKQNFAQVTNPPIDPIREELVMSLVSFIGPRPNIFDLVGNSRRKRLEVRQPILTNGDLEKIRSIGHTEDRFDTKTIDITYTSAEGEAGHAGAVERLCERAEAAVAGRLQHHHPVGPATRRRPDRDSRLAGHGGRAPSSHPQGSADLGRAGGGIRRAARGASFLLPGRLWRGGDQPLSRLRHAARHAQARRVPAGGRRA